MATISSLGVGSNLDLASLLTQLQTAESQPLVALQDKAKSYTTKLTAYGTIQSALSTLQTAAQKLGDPSLFQTVTGTPTVSGILAASATDVSAAGNYTIDVKQLAQAQTLIGAGQASTKTAIGNGQVTIDFGTVSGGTLDPVTGQYSGATFTPDATKTGKSITIDPSNNTLEGIRNAINSSDAGVTATIVNDGSGAPNRLVLTSTATGEESSMRISVVGDAALKNLLGNDPAGVQNMKQTAAAQDAKLNVSGIDVVSSTNTVEGAIQGATLTLVNTGKTGPVDEAEHREREDRDQRLREGLQQPADHGQIADRLRRGHQHRRRAGGRHHAAQPADAHPPGAHHAAGRRRRRHEGAHRDRRVVPEGRHAGRRLRQARQGHGRGPGGVANLFSSATGSTGGYGKQIDAMVTDLNTGALKVASDGVTSSIKQLDEQYDNMQTRVDATVARYKAQFTQLDVLINSMNNTKNYLTQQFEAMSGSSNS
jgi:flagellar hook-associated protein 2